MAVARPRASIFRPASRPRARGGALGAGGYRTATKRPPLFIWLPAVIVAGLMLVPIAYLIIRASEAGSAIWPLIFRERTALIAWNTVRLTAGVSVAASAIAVLFAFLTTRTDVPLRRFWATVAALPLVIPSYVGALTFIAAFGPRGTLQSWLAPLGVDRLPSIYGYTGAWLALTLFTYPYVYLAVRAALNGLDPSLSEASRSLGYGPWRTFFTCTLPQLRPAIGAGALLAALYTISDFGVVTLMRYEAFTRAIYTQYRAAFDRTLAAALGLMLVAFALVLLFGESRMRGRALYYRLGSGASRRAKPIPLGVWRWPAFGFCATMMGLSLGVPFAILLSWLFTGADSGTGISRLPTATLNSVTVALAAALVATLAAIPVALLAIRYSGRLGGFVERLTFVGYALPSIVIALAFVFLGARYLPGLYQTLPWLILACVVRYLPQAVGSARTALLQVNPRLEEASRSLGRNNLMTVTRVTVPLISGGLGAGAVLVFLTVMKELPLVLLLSPTGYPTLAASIWNATDSGGYSAAAAPALLLILIAAVPTLMLSLREQRRATTIATDVDDAR